MSTERGWSGSGGEDQIHDHREVIGGLGVLALEPELLEQVIGEDRGVQDELVRHGHHAVGDDGVVELPGPVASAPGAPGPRDAAPRVVREAILQGESVPVRGVGRAEGLRVMDGAGLLQTR